MRIVHLSDIHLSNDNYLEFKNNFRDALIADLVNYNNHIKIDVIVITGDLVDKGGDSLYEIKGFEDKSKYKSPYYIFEEIFIQPIINALNFSKDNFLFIPGNHDVNENNIFLREEYKLYNELTLENCEKYLKDNLTYKYSERIKEFKEFERYFHEKNNKYFFTENESTYTYEFNNKKIGFLLINDSWRCRSIKFKDEDDKIYFGKQQLYDGYEKLKRNETKINIVLFHHPPSSFYEENEIIGFLNRKEDVDVLLFGHYHSSQSYNYITHSGGCFYLRSKASFLKPDEKDLDYIPGYQIIDIDVDFYKIIKIEHKRYNNKPDSKAFIFDNTIGDIGIDKNKFSGNTGYSFSKRIENSDFKKFNKEDFKS